MITTGPDKENYHWGDKKVHEEYSHYDTQHVDINENYISLDL